MPGKSLAARSAPKWIVLGAWLLGALSFLAPGEGGLVAVGRAIFWTLAVVHAIECLVFLPRLRRAPGSLARHLQQTFLYGILHVREIPAAQDAGGGAAGD
jgi:uncharacterized protein YhhL (DUF1145 family)